MPSNCEKTAWDDTRTKPAPARLLIPAIALLQLLCVCVMFCRRFMGLPEQKFPLVAFNKSGKKGVIRWFVAPGSPRRVLIFGFAEKISDGISRGEEMKSKKLVLRIRTFNNDNI